MPLGFPLHPINRTDILTRRRWLVTTAFAALGTLTAPRRAHAELTRAPHLTVHKDVECRCCTAWVAHMRHAGFEVRVVDVVSRDALAALKDELGIPISLRSCHTALISAAGGNARPYLIEGHVPAEAISRLLVEHPLVLGLAVPGMPSGPPGMEFPSDARESNAYEVLTFQEGGVAGSFGRYPGRRRRSAA
ncbi:MAG: DUF411 domain-containing protein [Gemmatimonadaceae bacterium]